MTWWTYVERTSNGASQTEMARTTGLSGPTLSRWKSGKQGVDPYSAATFARAYGRPVLEAFVAAGFLSPEEAKAQVTVPDPDRLTDDQLVDVLRARLHLRDEARDDRDTAPNTPAGGSPAPAPSDVALAAQAGVPEHMPDTTTGEESQDPGGHEPA